LAVGAVREPPLTNRIGITWKVTQYLVHDYPAQLGQFLQNHAKVIDQAKVKRLPYNTWQVTMLGIVW